MYRLIVPLFCCLILFVWSQVLAQDEAWTVWLHQPASGRMLHIDSNGAVLDTQRITVTSQQMLPEQVIVAPDGLKAAYVVRNQATFEQQLIVTNLETGNQLAEVRLSELSESYTQDDVLHIFDASFSADSEQLVYIERIGGQAWTIFVYDISLARITHELRQGDSLAIPFPPLHPSALPYVQSVQGDAIHFTLATATVPQQHNYRWLYRAGELVETRAAPSLDGAYLWTTHEIISPLPDWRFSAAHADIELGYQQRNTLSIYDPETMTRYPFYTNESMDFQAVWFVQNGERVLAEAYVDPLNTWWVLLDRQGRDVERMPRAGFDVTSTPNGFIYATQVAAQTALVHVNTRWDADAARTVWVDNGEWRVLWATMTRIRTEQPRWARLAEPEPTLPASNPLATPTQFPTPLPVLRPGILAELQTEEDAYLNMRDAPSLAGEVLALLEDGVQVVLIDGPIVADDFIWWQVRVGGRLGWVVEALPDIQTIVLPAPLDADEQAD